MAEWQEYGVASGWEENWPLVIYADSGTTTSTASPYSWPSCTIPADTLKSNDSILIFASWDFSQNASSAYITLDIGGSESDLINIPNVGGSDFSLNRIITVLNDNSQSSQYSGTSTTMIRGIGTTDNAAASFSYNLATNALNINFKSTISAAGTTTFNTKIVHFREPV